MTRRAEGFRRPGRAGRFRGLRIGAAVSLIALAVAGCGPNLGDPVVIGGGHLAVPGPDGEEDARGVQPTSPVTSVPATRPAGQTVLLADDRRASAPLRPVREGPALQGPPVSLNISNTPVPDAAQAVLGEVLGLPFTVDPTVAGSVTLRITEPIPRGALLAAFQGALAGSGTALFEQNGIWRVAPVGAVPSQQETILPRFVAASELAKALELALPPEQIRTLRLGSGEAIVVRGKASELDLARRTVEAVDQPALAGMSILLVGLANTRPDAMATELGAIFGGDAAPTVGESGLEVSGGGLKVVPLSRLGAIALLARDNATLDRALRFVRQLDRPRENAGKRLFIYRVQNRSAETLADALRALFNAPTAAEDPNVVFDLAEEEPPKISVDTERNALVIAAPASSFRSLVDLISQLDAAPMQVLVEATILEVQLGDTLRYGVQYAFQTGELFDGRDGLAVLSQGASSAISPTLPGFAFSIGTRLAPEIIIEALDEVTDLTVVSSPKLLVRDNQAATLQVGDQVPIVTRTAEGFEDDSRIVNSVEYRDTGVTLVVTPRVNSGGYVSLAIDQEISTVGATTTSDIDSPTFSRRRITTDVAVESGNTVVLGGLIQDIGSTGRSGVPIAQDIPVIGGLFGTRNQQQSRTELLILLRPHILRVPGEASSVTTQLRSEFEAIAIASGRSNAVRRVNRVTLPFSE